MITPGRILVVASAVVALVLPLVLSSAQVSTYVLIILAAILAIGLSLLMGYAGQVSLGHAAFYAIGAYTAGLLAVHGVPPIVALAAAPAAAWVSAMAVGGPLLRLRGHYLAFGTLAFQLILLNVISEAKGITGGDPGLSGIPPLALGPFQVTDPIPFAYVSLVACGGVLLLSRNLIHSRPGRALRALSASEVSAAAMGVSVVREKALIFGLSAAYAGLAGGIYAFFLGYISPPSFPVLLSIELLVMVTVGGLGTLGGAVLGAVLIGVLVEWLKEIGTAPGLPAYAPAALSYSVYAVVLIAVLLLMPEGLVPWSRARVADLTNRRLGHRRSPTRATPH
jgi:branched-chain amino acid transport system permease protein